MELESRPQHSTTPDLSRSNLITDDSLGPPDEDQTESQLPPVDGGKHAYLFLAAGFMIEALIWGFSFAYGIFQDYYSSHESFKSSGNIAVIGTCMMGVNYLISPITFVLLQGLPSLKRWSCPAGFVVMCLALALSSFAANTTHLILTQGIAYGIGASFAYSPVIIFMNEWFVQKRGLAFGLMWAGTGVSGVVLPLVLQWLLDSYGHKTTLRIWALVLFLMSSPLVYFVKPRLPISRASSIRTFDLSFLWQHTFVIFQMGNIVEALGYFLPTIYLPTFARTLGANSIMASLTVILCNLASVFGCVAMGHLVDRYHATTCILISTIGSTIAVFLFWGLSVSLAPLYVFCVVYGLFAGSFTSTWPAVMNEVVKKSQLADPSIVFGFLSTGRGIGNVVSGPLSDALIKGSWSHEASSFAYGTSYGPLIVFTGITALFGGLSIIARPFKLV
ncbi:major facilitator superfamily domain-containing protein [Aspergillus avenaceus]|uniref:Major facilitator superfamily domain-containing protein n=1 Tax=Aspergillus avenaceus TaxID=36643 RepID=A0A5N6TV44_ASPAV|nr:major facilitator superfamily domain-containing protein [Aspergillus avenaceus]